MRKLLPVLIAIAFPLWASAESADYRLEVLAEPLEHPWSIAFLPDGGILVTERPGRLRFVAQEGLLPAPVEGLPEVFASGQGGLFEVMLAEDFADSGVLFLSYAHGNSDANHTRVARARFDGRMLLDVTPVFTTQPPKSGDAYYGGRMAWMPDGTLLLGTGDGFFFREESQNLDSHLEKSFAFATTAVCPRTTPSWARQA